MQLIASYLIGLVFGVGIAISGMINPAKVINFFDVAGTWDPSLMFVMGGALAVTFIGYRLVFTRPRPLLGASFQLPAKTSLDVQLLGGSALFGIGWGMTGFCPGGALPALGTGRIEVFAFVGALIVGILIARALMALTAGRAPGNPARKPA